METVEQLVETYFAAWNETDAGRRGHLLEQTWADDGELVTPRVGRLSGRQAILEHIGGFSERFPGARVIRTSAIQSHNGFLRYSWRIVRADGSTLVDGTDFGALGSDGRLRLIAEFDDG